MTFGLLQLSVVTLAIAWLALQVATDVRLWGGGLILGLSVTPVTLIGSSKPLRL